MTILNHDVIQTGGVSMIGVQAVGQGAQAQQATAQDHGQVHQAGRDLHTG